LELKIVNLDQVQEFIDKGRLKPKPNSFLTIRDLLVSGIISDVKDGVKLLAKVTHLTIYFSIELLINVLNFV
jgi:hypothetical protein